MENVPDLPPVVFAPPVVDTMITEATDYATLLRECEMAQESAISFTLELERLKEQHAKELFVVGESLTTWAVKYTAMEQHARRNAAALTVAYNALQTLVEQVGRVRVSEEIAEHAPGLMRAYIEASELLALAGREAK